MNLTPEQLAAIGVAAVGFVVALFIAGAKLTSWFPDYVTRLAEQKIEEKKQDLRLEQIDSETEIEAKKAEMEIRRRQELALSETVERVLVMFSQTQERHAKVDERNADNAEKRVESDKQLATAIENLTRSAMTSQLWQENRANDFLDTANLINEKMGELSRVGKSAMEALDRLEIGLIEARGKLTSVFEHQGKNAQESTLLAIETQLKSLSIMVESLTPKAQASPLPENLIDTKELTAEDMLAATRIFPDAETPTNSSQESNDKKENAA